MYNRPMSLPPADDQLRAKFQEYQRLYSTDPDDRIWSAVAEAFSIVGDRARTIGACEQAVLINPEWGRHHLDLAKSYLRAKEWVLATNALQRCAELDASGCRSEHFSESFLYYLGYALFGAGRYKEAAEAWRGGDHVINYWGAPEPLKDFHQHRGWAYHLEGHFLDAIECYRRALVAPGPGDTALDDDMEPEAVEECQETMNPGIESFHDMAQTGERIDIDHLEATPYTH